MESLPPAIARHERADRSVFYKIDRTHSFEILRFCGSAVLNNSRPFGWKRTLKRQLLNEKLPFLPVLVLLSSVLNSLFDIRYSIFIILY
jgi:hypothetical protein